MRICSMERQTDRETQTFLAVIKTERICHLRERQTDRQTVLCTGIVGNETDCGGPCAADSHRHGHCVAMGSGKAAGLWSSQECHVALKAVCKLPRDGFPQPPVPPNKQQSTCPTNWIATNSSLCYQVKRTLVLPGKARTFVIPGKAYTCYQVKCTLTRYSVHLLYQVKRTLM